MRKDILIWAMIVLAILLMSYYGIYRYGRHVMYSQVCATLEVTEKRHIKVGNKTIMPEGIHTEDAPREPEPIVDICNMCHVGGIQ